MARARCPELMGVYEVAQALKVAPQNLSGSNTPAGLPEPVCELKATRVWLASEILAFAPEFFERRKKYRPAKEEPEPVAA